MRFREPGDLATIGARLERLERQIDHASAVRPPHRQAARPGAAGAEDPAVVVMRAQSEGAELTRRVARLESDDDAAEALWARTLATFGMEAFEA